MRSSNLSQYMKICLREDKQQNAYLCAGDCDPNVAPNCLYDGTGCPNKKIVCYDNKIEQVAGTMKEFFIIKSTNQVTLLAYPFAELFSNTEEGTCPIGVCAVEPDSTYADKQSTCTSWPDCGGSQNQNIDGLALLAVNQQLQHNLYTLKCINYHLDDQGVAVSNTDYVASVPFYLTVAEDYCPVTATDPPNLQTTYWFTIDKSTRPYALIESIANTQDICKLKTVEVYADAGFTTLHTKLEVVKDGNDYKVQIPDADKSIEADYEFYIKGTYFGGQSTTTPQVEYKVASKVTLSVRFDCTNIEFTDEFTTTLSTTKEISLNADSNDKWWSFNEFTCDKTDCCTGLNELTYTVSASNVLTAGATVVLGSVTAVEAGISGQKKFAPNNLVTKQEIDLYIHAQTVSGEGHFTAQLKLKVDCFSHSVNALTDIGYNQVLKSSRILSDKQFVNVDDLGDAGAGGGQKTWFIMPQFTLANPICQPVTAKFFPETNPEVYTITSNHPDSSTLQYFVAPNTKSDHEKHLIQIRLTMEGGFTVDITSTLRYLHVGCKEGLTAVLGTQSRFIEIYLNDPVEAMDWKDVSYSAQNNGNVDETLVYCTLASTQIMKAGTQNDYRGASKNNVFDSSDVVWTTGQTQQPFTKISVKTTNPTTSALYFFKLSCTTNGGFVSTIVSWFSIAIICRKDQGTLDNNAVYQVKKVSQGSTDNKFLFLPFQCLPAACCPTDQIKYQVSTDNTLPTSVGHSFVVTGISYVTPNYYFQANTNLIANYTLYIHGQSIYYEFEYFTSQVEFKVECVPSSVNIIVQTWPTGMSEQQLVNSGSSAKFLTMTDITITEVGCPLIEFSVVETTDPAKATQWALFKVPQFGVHEVVPADTSEHKEYSFYVKLRALGDKTYFSSKFELLVGCTESLIKFQNKLFVDVKLMKVGESPTLVYTYENPTTDRTYCVVTKNELVDVKNNSISDPSSIFLSSSCPSTGACSTVDLKGSDYISILTFKIKSFFGPRTDVFYISKMISLAAICSDNNNQIQSSFTTTAFTLYQNDLVANKIIFGLFECTNPSCCTSKDYIITSEGSGSPKQHDSFQAVVYDQAALQNQSLSSIIDVSTLTTFKFYVWYKNELNQTKFSGQLSLEVTYPCHLDKITAIGSTQMVSNEVDSIQSLILPVSSRFEKLSPAGYCMITNYRIDKVVEGQTNQNLKEADVSELFQILSSGTLTVQKFDQVYLNYKIFVAPFNGMIWANFLDGADAKQVVDISFTAKDYVPPNLPPFFEEALSAPQLDLGVNPEGIIEYQLPQALDSNSSHIVSAKVDGLQEWMTFDEPSLKFSFDLSKAKQEDATYPLQITLSDQFQATSTQTIDILVKKKVEEEEVEKEADQQETTKQSSIVQASSGQQSNFTFQGFEKTNSSNSENVITQNKTQSQTVQKKTKIMAAKVKSISTIGLVIIEFNSTVDSFNEKQLKMLNTSSISIELQPSWENYSEEEDLSFGWEVVSLNESRLSLQLNFDNPLKISPGQVLDRLIVTFEDRSLFYSKELNKILNRNFKTIQGTVPSQIPNTQATRDVISNAETSEKLMKILILVTFLMNLTMEGGMKYMMSMIRSTQMIFHIPMTKCTLPGQVQELFKILIPVVMFDLIGNYGEKIIPQEDNVVESQQSRIGDQTVNLGYESYNSFLNLGSVFLFTAFYFVQVGFFLVYKLGSLIFSIKLPFFEGGTKQRKKSFFEKRKESLFFSSILSLITEAYLEYLISSYYGLQDYREESVLSRMSYGVAFSFLVITCGIVPLLFIYIMCQKKETLKQPVFERRWGTLYEGIKTGDKTSMLYSGFFMARRLVFVFLIVFGFQVMIYQILAMFYLNLIMMIYIGNSRPFVTRRDNNIEFINEIFIWMSTMHIILFTEFVKDEEVRYMCGWSMLAVISCCMLFNLSFVFYFGLRQVYLFLVKIKNRFVRAIRKLLGLKDNRQIKSLSALTAPEVNVDPLQEESSESSETNSEERVVIQTLAFQFQEASLQRNRHFGSSQISKRVQQLKNSLEDSGSLSQISECPSLSIESRKESSIQVIIRKNDADQGEQNKNQSKENIFGKNQGNSGFVMVIDKKEFHHGESTAQANESEIDLELGGFAPKIFEELKKEMKIEEFDSPNLAHRELQQIFTKNEQSQENILELQKSENKNQVPSVISSPSPIKPEPMVSKSDAQHLADNSDKKVSKPKPQLFKQPSPATESLFKKISSPHQKPQEKTIKEIFDDQSGTGEKFMFGIELEKFKDFDSQGKVKLYGKKVNKDVQSSKVKKLKTQIKVMMGELIDQKNQDKPVAQKTRTETSSKKAQTMAKETRSESRPGSLQSLGDEEDGLDQLRKIGEEGGLQTKNFHLKTRK